MKDESAVLWTKNFWLVCLAGFCLSASLYMLLPVFPLWMMSTYAAKPYEAAAIMAVFGLSVFVLGPFFNFLMDHYRRKAVCQIALLAVAASTAGFHFVGGLETIFWLRILQGAMFGLASATLGSTLAIDLSNSTRRTDANSAYFWFQRFGMALGPMAGVLVFQILGLFQVIIVSIALGGLALLLVTDTRIPFRAPLFPDVFSLDRFLLLKGLWPSLNYFLIAAVFGISLTCNMSFGFYGCIMLGFSLSLLANRFAFSNADERAEVVCGLIFLFFAMLLQFTHPYNEMALCVSAALIGLGVGLTSTRFLINMLGLAEHCQRGTANTTYMLSWESGIALGYFLGYTLVGYYSTDFWTTKCGVGLVLCVVSLVLYLLVTSRYLNKHKSKV